MHSPRLWRYPPFLAHAPLSPIAAPAIPWMAIQPPMAFICIVLEEFSRHRKVIIFTMAKWPTHDTFWHTESTHCELFCHTKYLATRQTGTAAAQTSSPSSSLFPIFLFGRREEMDRSGSISAKPPASSGRQRSAVPPRSEAALSVCCCPITNNSWKN